MNNQRYKFFRKNHKNARGEEFADVMSTVYDLREFCQQYNFQCGLHGEANIIVLQSTGKRDKNKVEICDGDIVSFGDQYIGLVHWFEKTARWSVHEKKESITEGDLGIFDYYVPIVIGNIHTDKHLFPVKLTIQ